MAISSSRHLLRLSETKQEKRKKYIETDIVCHRELHAFHISAESKTKQNPPTKTT